MTVTIGLPCQLITVRVRTAPSGHLTLLEEVALRAIGSGVDRFDRLAAFLGLGTRVNLDLIEGLWRASYIRVDRRSASISLAPQVANKVNQPAQLRELGPSRADDELWELAVDLVSSRIVPVEQTRTGHDLEVAPPPRAAWTVDALDNQELLTAVMAAHRRRHGLRPDAPAVLSATLAKPAPLAPRRSVPYLPVVVSVSEVENDRVLVRIEPDQPIGAIHRDRIERYLAEITRAHTTSRFGRALRARASTVFTDRPSLRDRLRRFGNRVEGLSGTPYGTWDERQRELERQAESIDAELASRERAETAATLSTDAETQFQALKDAIRHADKQIVLVGPWIEADPFNELLDVLIEALDQRGVRVYVVWGYEHGSELRNDVANLIINQQRRFPQQLFVNRQSAQTHAKLAICDDRWALVSSLNLLASKRQKIEAGTILGATASSRTAIEELLRWVRDEVFPDAVIARGILASASAFGRSDEAASISRIDLSELAADIEDPGDEDRVDLVRRLWQAEWQSVAESMNQRYAGLPVHVDRVAIDAVNQALLSDALASSRRTLVITSDQLSPAVVTGRLLAQIEERLAAGVSVRMIHQRWSNSSAEDARRVRETCVRLADNYGSAFERLEVPGWHAKVLVSDDQVTVSSFNFLSFDGHYREGRRARRSELGVTLTGGDVARRFSESICRLAHAAPLPERAGRFEELDVFDVDRPLAAVARRLVSGATLAERRRAATSMGPGDAARVLQLLDARQASAAAVADVATVLISSRGSGTNLEPWVDRLVSHLWRQRRLAEAMIIRHDLGGEGEPTAWTTELGAFSQSAQFDDWLGTCVDRLADRSRDERRVLGLAATAEALLPQNDVPPRNAPRILALLPEGDLELLPRSVVEFVGRYGPLPAAYVEQSTAALAHQDRAAELTRELLTRLDSWISASPPGRDGTKIRAYLQRSASIPSVLRVAAVASDKGALDRWRQTYGADGADALYVQVEQASKSSHGSYGGKRVRYIDRHIASVLTAANALSAELAEDTTDPLGSFVEFQPVAAELQDALPDGESSISDLPETLRIAAEPSIERLRKLWKGRPR